MFGERPPVSSSLVIVLGVSCGSRSCASDSGIAYLPTKRTVALVVGQIREATAQKRPCGSADVNNILDQVLHSDDVLNRAACFSLPPRNGAVITVWKAHHR